MNGPTLNRALLEQQYPGGQLLRNTGRELGQRGSPRALHRSGDRRLRARAGAQHGDQRRLRARVQPRSADVVRPQPGPARDDGGDVAARSSGKRDPERGGRGAHSEVRDICAVHDRGHAAVERRQDRLRRAAHRVQQAVQQQLQRARLLHARLLARQHLRQRRAGEWLPGPRRHAPRAQRGPDRRSTPGTTW